MRRVRINRMELLRRMTSIPSLPICRSASAIALLQMWDFLVRGRRDAPVKPPMSSGSIYPLLAPFTRNERTGPEAAHNDLLPHAVAQHVGLYAECLI